MILSNTALFAALDEGRVIISPQPAPRSPQPDAESPFATTAVDLRLGDEISWFKADGGLTIDLAGGGFKQLFARNSDTTTITAHQPYKLNPHTFILANTLEEIELPLVPGLPVLAARVEGHSSFARCGLLVHFTAPTIHAGFKGKITLEIINLGPYPINLSPGLPICQLIVEEVSGQPIRNDSQFQQQTRPGGESQ